MQDGASVLRQQGLTQPVKSVLDRNEVKWHCEHQVAGTNKFDTLLWKIEFANVGQLHNDLRLVMPCYFQFQDKGGRPVDFPQVAPRTDPREMFQEVRITINGTLFSLRPSDFEHLNWVAQPAEYRMTRDVNTKLPVALSSRWQSTALVNEGFVRRAKDFSNKAHFSDVEEPDLTLGIGYVYEHDFYLRLSHVIWKDWLRQGELNTQKAGNLFEMLVELVFRKDASVNDLAQDAKAENVVWAHSFDIGNELCWGTATPAELTVSARQGTVYEPCTSAHIIPYKAAHDDFFSITHAGGTFTILGVSGQVRPSRENGNIATYINTNVSWNQNNIDLLDKEFIQFQRGLDMQGHGGAKDDEWNSLYIDMQDGGGRVFYVYDVAEYTDATDGNQKMRLYIWGSPTEDALGNRIFPDLTEFRIVRNYFVTTPEALQWRCGDEIICDTQAGLLTTKVVKTVYKENECRVYVWDDLPNMALRTPDVTVLAAAVTVQHDEYIGVVRNTMAGRGVLSHSSITAFDAPSPNRDYTEEVVTFYDSESRQKYTVDEVVEVFSTNPDHVTNMNASNFYTVKAIYENNVVLRFALDVMNERANELFDSSLAHPYDFTQADQQTHMAGSVLVRHIRCGKTPIARIQAVWREDPYLQWERVKSQQAVPDVMTFPLTENEVYRAEVVLPVDGALTSARLQELRVLTGWSRMFVYCSLRSEHRDLEYWTALRNVLPRITDIKLRVNEKYALKGTESRRWFFRRFLESTNADICYEEWENQCVICLRPEHLAYEDFFAGSAKLTTMGIECNVGHSNAWTNMYQNLRHVQTTLNLNAETTGASEFRSPYGATFATQTYLRDMQWEMRVVFEYSRKQVQLASNGSVSIRDNLISRQRDGLQLSTAVPRPIKVSGSHMEAYKK